MAHLHDKPKRLEGQFSDYLAFEEGIEQPKDNEENENEDGESVVEVAQKVFRAALASSNNGFELNGKTNGQGNGKFDGCGPRYKRTDKINYEFRGYDLAFASFELKVDV